MIGFALWLLAVVLTGWNVAAGVVRGGWSVFVTHAPMIAIIAAAVAVALVIARRVAAR